jgi:hypothetical protein
MGFYKHPDEYPRVGIIDIDINPQMEVVEAVITSMP